MLKIGLIIDHFGDILEKKSKSTDSSSILAFW